jgi:hypothetical protein
MERRKERRRNQRQVEKGCKLVVAELLCDLVLGLGLDLVEGSA